MFIYNCKNYVLFKRVLFEYIDIITNIVFINIWSLDFHHRRCEGTFFNENKNVNNVLEEKS